MKSTFLLATVLTSVLSVPVIAHHGDAGRYDETPFIITGTVVEIKLANPHSILVFDATDASGKVVRWQAEMGSGQQLVRQFGWTKENLKIGDKITLNGRKVITCPHDGHAPFLPALPSGTSKTFLQRGLGHWVSMGNVRNEPRTQ